MGTFPRLKTLAAPVLLGGLSFFMFGGEVLGQVRPIVVPYRGGGSSDLAPFLAGICVFLPLLIAVLTFLVLPALARAMGKEPNEGACVGLAIPLSIVLLWVLWKPLHLTTVCQWTWGLMVGLIVLGIVGAILVTLSKGAAGLFSAGQNHNEGASGFFLLVVIGIGTMVLNMKTHWGFWLSCLAVVGGVVGGLLLIALFVELVKAVSKAAKKK